MKTLGLDLGPNSIGWALIDDTLPNPLVDCGVRVFPEGVDNFDSAKEASRNEQRRLARSMRRQIRRRAHRRKLLKNALVEIGLWPIEAKAQETLTQLDPFALRARALAEKLSEHELGRIILHLNQRRGFLSLRKKAPGKDKELEGMLKQINELQQTLDGQTLGQYLHSEQQRDPLIRLRGRHTQRKMIEDELLAIWIAQQPYHPKLLTDSLLYGSFGKQDTQKTREPIRRDSKKTLVQQFGIHGILFHQRPIYWPASLVGKCELEKGQKRCHRADWLAQKFRILQEVNNLRYIDPATHQEQRLTDEQRDLVVKDLMASENRTFDQIRKRLGLIESIKFNLERGERAKLKGHLTDHMLAGKDVIGKSWRLYPEAKREAIVRLLLDTRVSEEDSKRRLKEEHCLSPEEIETLLGIDFGTGYVRFSRLAMQKMLPHLEKGMIVTEAMEAAGYLRRDQLAKRLFDKLPSLSQIRSGPLADLNNPVVKAALYELRKVVNAIIKEHGKPDEVHIEMARSLKMGPEKRSEYNKKNREREQQREQIVEELREKGISVSRESILRFELWKQQGQTCIYSGNAINCTQLFGGEVDIDHILPYSRTLDDSQANKVLCFRSENQAKGKQTPFEWLAGRDSKRYEEVIQRAQSLPYPKRMRFSQKEVVLDKFIERQLVDTGYISRLACEYVKLLMDKDHQVIGTKGSLTAELRHQWELDDLLSELPDSPAWAFQSNLRPGEKNRADHRHHAVDAIVVALTTRSRLVQFAGIRERGGTRVTGEVLELPWNNIRRDVQEKLKTVLVSHRVQRKVCGALHEDSKYGPTHDSRTGKPVDGVFVIRKPVDALSGNEIEKIRDEGIKRLVIRALEKSGILYGRKAKIEPKQLQMAVADLHMTAADGRKIPIKRVRILKDDKTIRPIRVGRPDQTYVKPGSTHHLCIFEWNETDAKGKSKRVRDAIFVTMLEASERIKLGKEIIDRTHPTKPDAKFVMSLSAGELVLVKQKGKQLLLKFKTAASTQGQIYFCLHADSRKSADYQKFVFTCNTLDARKVTVTPTGKLRWAND